MNKCPSNQEIQKHNSKLQAVFPIKSNVLHFLKEINR